MSTTSAVSSGLALSLLVGLGLALPALPGLLTSPGVASSSLVTRLLVYELALTGLGLAAALGARAFLAGTSPGAFSLGSLDAPVTPLRLLGLGTSAGASWRSEIVGMTFAVSAVTSLFVYFANRATFSWQQAFERAPWILLFAALNAAGEEWLYRVALLRAGEGVTSPELSCLLSAAVFGIAHLRGMPGGIGGAFAAGLLGFVLSRATLETHGIATAWSVHFLQDVLIFGGWLGAAPGAASVVPAAPA
jgi:hypothetical protein